MSRGRASALAAAAMAAIGMGCGSEGSRPRAAPPPGSHAAPRPDSLLQLPAQVPRRATGPADPAATRVIRAWTRALRRGDIVKAASYFAIPSRVQNATPLLTLASINDARAFNVSLPCGARPVRAGGAGRFTIVTFRLTERVDGDCMGAAGRLARCAISVVHGRITEWYRLADPEPPPAVDQDSSRAALRRLRLHGLIVRLPHSNTYALTPEGIRVAVFYSKLQNKLLRPLLDADKPPAPVPVRRALATLEHAVNDYVHNARLAA